VRERERLGSRKTRRPGHEGAFASHKDAAARGQRDRVAHKDAAGAAEEKDLHGPRSLRQVGGMPRRREGRAACVGCDVGGSIVEDLVRGVVAPSVVLQQKANLRPVLPPQGTRVTGVARFRAALAAAREWACARLDSVADHGRVRAVIHRDSCHVAARHDVSLDCRAYVHPLKQGVQEMQGKITASSTWNVAVTSSCSHMPYLHQIIVSFIFYLHALLESGRAESLAPFVVRNGVRLEKRRGVSL
jgi:hypothetical protein